MNPSYQHYATHDESEFPHLWRGVVGAWAPCLGPSGTRLHDHSGRANWGTLTNMTLADRWVVQDGLNALSFVASTNQYVEISSAQNQLSLPPKSFSLSVWCRPTSAGTIVGRDVLSKHFGGGFPFISYSLDFPESAGASRFRFSAGVTGNVFLSIQTANTIGLNRLYHVVATYDGVAMRIFINSALEGELAEARDVIFNTQPLTLGRWFGNTSTDESFVGQIFDVIIRDYAMSRNLIREEFEAGPAAMYTPRRRRRAYFGPLFQAGWARGSNVILQPCGVS